MWPSSTDSCQRNQRCQVAVSGQITYLGSAPEQTAETGTQKGGQRPGLSGYPIVSRYSATTRTSSLVGVTMMGFRALLSGRRATSSTSPDIPTLVTFHRFSV